MNQVPFSHQGSSVLSKLALVRSNVRSTSDVGDIAETFVRASLLLLGFNVIVVDRASSKFDLLLEQPDRFLKIQVKSGSLSNGVVKFNTCRVPNNISNRKRIPYLMSEVDLFGVFCCELMTVYLVPQKDVPLGGICCLRIDSPKNFQKQGVRLASDFELFRFS